MKNKLQQNFSFQKLICFLAIFLFGIKFFAWYLTDSMAILSDTFESLINIISGFIALYSLHLAKIPKDKNHPYGHGKIEFISAAIEGLLIAIAAFGIIIEAFIRMLKQKEQVIEKLDYGIFLLLITALINYIIGYNGYKKAKKNNSASLMASGRHLMADAYSTLGLSLGLILLHFTHWIWLDLMIAFGFSLITLFMGLKLLRGALAGIMDEYDEKLIEELLFYLETHKKENWIDIHNLRIIKYGSSLHLDCHLRLPWQLNVEEAHKEIKDFEELVKKKFQGQIELFVHLNSCNKNFCAHCINKNCPIRKEEFKGFISWNLKNVCKTK